MNALIIEDEELVCDALAVVVEREFQFDEVQVAGDGALAWEIFKREDFDFAVLDLMLPKMDGLTLARKMVDRQPWVRILALSSECDDYTIREVNRSGILGFVTKQEMGLKVLIEALREVSSGRTYYSTIAQQFLANMWTDPLAYYKVLSDREFQVLRAIAQGLSYDQIAQEMKISAFTVRRHKHNAMKKLNIRDTAELLRFALQKGIVKHKGGLDWTDVSYQKHPLEAGARSE